MENDKRPQREAPTYAELLEFAAGLPPEEAEALLARARPAPQAPELEATGPTPAPPAYVSWEDFLARTTPAGRMAWCRKKAARARFNGGSNAPGNLTWACLWCNTWPSERRPGATDHGGIQPIHD